MNRALLKQDAKDAMSQASPHPALTTLAYLAITLSASFVLSMVSMLTTGAGLVLDTITSNGSGEGFGVFTGVGSFVYIVAALLFGLLLGTIQFGYQVYCLKVFKKEDTGVGELFSHFKKLFKIFGLSLWMGLFIILWSCLCYIPGIIAALRYSQAFFILAENPDKSIRECVNESKEMMSGRLWEYFVLQISFILWHLLTSFTCGIASLYVMPYMSITNAGYYLSLKHDDDIVDSIPVNDAFNPAYGDSYTDTTLS